jgi:N6-L-threonylcarbamoyladenine synthase
LLILGIETSCDETSAAVLEGKTILSNVIFSQIETHKKYGGVVPEIAAREHMNKLPVVVEEALEKSGKKLSDMDGIAVTYGPGLAGSLLVGLSYAKALAMAAGKKFIAVNHVEAHLLSPFLENENFKFPFIGIVVSGGHTNIYIAKAFGDYELKASTRDDAAGEAFDKVAKMLGLPYPGGPSVSKSAEKGDHKKIKTAFPQARMKDKSLDFSFSGLKTSVLYYIKNNEALIKSGEISIDDIADAFQTTIIKTIVGRVERIYHSDRIKSLAVSGGVAANRILKQELKKFADNKGISFYIPSPLLCTDNGAMIAYVGYEKLKNNMTSDMTVEAEPDLKL